MIRRTIEVEDESEYLAAERAIAMVRELKALDDATPDGKVLAVVEQQAAERGRKFTRDRLQDVLNVQAEALEKKMGAWLVLFLRRGPTCPRRALLGFGAAGLIAELTSEAGGVSELVACLTPHRDHTAYRQRLAEGRSIGNGMVEGACKTAIGRRLKQTGARSRVRRLERMAAWCCLCYGDQFDAYWSNTAGHRPHYVTAPLSNGLLEFRFDRTR
jgi:hypothetical protein